MNDNKNTTLLLQVTVTHNPTPRGPPELLKVCVRKIAWAASECVAWNSVQVAIGPSLCLHLTCIKNVMTSEMLIELNTKRPCAKIAPFLNLQRKSSSVWRNCCRMKKGCNARASLFNQAVRHTRSGKSGGSASRKN